MSFSYMEPISSYRDRTGEQVFSTFDDFILPDLNDGYYRAGDVERHLGSEKTKYIAKKNGDNEHREKLILREVIASKTILGCENVFNEIETESPFYLTEFLLRVLLIEQIY